METAERTLPRRRPPVVLVLAACAVAAVFVAHDTNRFSAPFGPSHDGFNAAQFMIGGRALVEEGPISSRLGASFSTVSGDRVLYAHHPPLVYLEDAAALAAPGSTELAARLPAIVSSIAFLVLLVLLLHECGFGAGAAAIGLLVASATPMFTEFGALTETHALGLAPTTLLVLLWQRARRGNEPSPWLLGVVAAVAMLTSWLAGLVAALVGGALLADRRRSLALGVLAGVGAGALATGAWVLWAYHGDLGEFLDRAFLRAGSSTVRRVTFRDMAARQRGYLADLFPVGGPFVVAVAAFGLFDRRVRPLLGVSLGAVIGYALMFRTGAYDHGYWLYCILLPLALGAAASAAAVTRLLAAVPRARGTGFVLAGLLVVALTAGVFRASDEQRQQRRAALLGAEARAVRWPPGQTVAYHAFGDRGPTDLIPWVLFYARRVPFGVDGPQSVPRDQLVLTIAGGRLVAVPGEQPTAAEGVSPRARAGR